MDGFIFPNVEYNLLNREIKDKRLLEYNFSKHVGPAKLSYNNLTNMLPEKFANLYQCIFEKTKREKEKPGLCVYLPLSNTKKIDT